MAAEAALALTCSDSVAPWLTIQPDVQIVISPEGERRRDAVFVAGVRTTFSF